MPSAPDDALIVFDAADQNTWDVFAGAHPLANFCQSWGWGEVKGQGEWTPVRVGLKRDGVLVAGAQILFRPLALGRTLAYAPRGPLVDPAADEAPVLLERLRELCAQRGAIALKIDPCLPAARSGELAALGATSLADEDGRFGGTQPKWVMRLDLTPGLDEVFGNFKSDYRNRIRKAGRRGVAVRAAETEADWRAFYDLLLTTADRQEFTVRAWSYFDAIRRELSGACAARVFLAEREGRAVGAILCVAFGPTTWYLYGGMNDEGRDHYSGYLLQWEAMQWAVERGCSTYDFRGIAPPDAEDSPLYSLNRFKAGFSPDTVEWAGEWDLVFNPLGYRAFQTLLPKVRAWLKKRR